MGRKVAMLLAVLLMVGIMLSGCGGKDDTSAQNEEYLKQISEMQQQIAQMQDSLQKEQEKAQATASETKNEGSAETQNGEVPDWFKDMMLGEGYEYFIENYPEWLGEEYKKWEDSQYYQWIYIDSNGNYRDMKLDLKDQFADCMDQAYPGFLADHDIVSVGAYWDGWWYHEDYGDIFMYSDDGSGTLESMVLFADTEPEPLVITDSGIVPVVEDVDAAFSPEKYVWIETDVFQDKQSVMRITFSDDERKAMHASFIYRLDDPNIYIFEEKWQTFDIDLYYVNRGGSFPPMWANEDQTFTISVDTKMTLNVAPLSVAYGEDFCNSINMNYYPFVVVE